MNFLNRFCLYPTFFILVQALCFCSPGRSGSEGQNAPVGFAAKDRMDSLLGDARLWALGEKIFFDTNLSEPPGQSCATCHGREAGWTGPDSDINLQSGIYPGAVPQRHGNRKPNSAAYATFAPSLQRVEEDGEFIFVGGNFWDGRATGHLLGNAAADQAQVPFLNPLEQNLTGAREVVDRIFASDYADLFRGVTSEVFGMDRASLHPDTAFAVAAIALAAFEHSTAVNSFSSKYDLYLAGKAELSQQETLGLELFGGKGLCSQCHPHLPGTDGSPPLFTDFTYDNLGFPKNPDNPYYTLPTEFNQDGSAWIDPGLAATLLDMPEYAAYAPENYGLHRVPTLRNILCRPSEDFVKAYGHNGYFKSLEDVIHFYNKRDVLPYCTEIDDPQPGVNCWPEPEVAENVNSEELGDLGLSAVEEAALTAFLSTLSDGYMPAD